MLSALRRAKLKRVPPLLRMHQRKRAKWDAEGVLDLRSWLADQGRGTPVQVSRPVQLSCWTKASTSEGGGIAVGSTAGLHAFRPPRPPIDLNEGRDSYVAKAANDKGDVEIVIQAATSAGAALSECDVVTFRNNLNKIAGTPLDPMNAWSVDACWKGSTLYLDIVQLEPQWQGNPADADKFTYWGYRFEAACTGQQVTDSSSEYGILVRTRLGGIRILLGAEVDCYDPAVCVGVCGDQQPGLSSYLELKTYKQPQHAKQQFNLHRHKHPRWWLQSFLAGVPALALGARDDQGLVHKVDLVKVADLPRISAASGAAWDPQLALRFGEHCLKWMQSVAAAHAEQQVRFSYDSTSRTVRYELLAGGDLPARLMRVLPGY